MPQAVSFDIVEPCAMTSPEIETEKARALAARYAPIFYQDTGRWPRADYITSVDFDGNIDPIDNRENINAYPLVGTVYYSVVETATHAFIVYTVFHPVNYGLFSDDTAETLENYMSGLMVVVDKAHPQWPPVVVETYMEGQFLHYVSRREINPGTERIDGEIPFEDEVHPRVFLEAGRHGCVISSDLILGVYTGEPGKDFMGGDGIVYRLSDKPKEPEGRNDRNAAYRLLPILDTLWKLRSFVGHRSVFSSAFRMDTGCEYPERFVASRPNRRSGSPPWAWDDIDDEDVKIGEWFMWPARVISSHLTVPSPFDLEYTYNPYLGIY